LKGPSRGEPRPARGRRPPTHRSLRLNRQARLPGGPPEHPYPPEVRRGSNGTLIRRSRRYCAIPAQRSWGPWGHAAMAPYELAGRDQLDRNAARRRASRSNSQSWPFDLLLLPAPKSAYKA
jgi:hypothetical protein